MIVRLLVLLACVLPAAALDLLPFTGDAPLASGEVVLDPGGSTSATVLVTPPPAGGALAADAWYARATVEVLEVTAAAPGATVVWTMRAGEHEASVKETVAVGLPSWRSECHVPPALLEEGVPLELGIRVDGATVRLGDLGVERFHRAPTRRLLGKANGPFGPDQLDSGALGFVGLTEHLHRAFSILEVRDGGAAAAAGMRVGDLVVGVEVRPLAASSLAPGTDWFERSHEVTLGRAIEAAWRGGREQVTVSVRREGLPLELELALSFPHAHDPGFPFSGELAEALRADLVGWTVRHQRGNGSWPGTDAVNPALGGLALLGTRDPSHAPAIRRVRDYLLQRYPRAAEIGGGCAYWHVAFQGIFLCEYHLASGDDAVLPWIEEAVAWLPTTTHECRWGMQAFGHGPDGLPYDGKALMAPTAHLLVFDALARRCGVESRVWEHARDYVLHSWSDPAAGGHGAMGYNASHKDLDEFWSRSGLTALAAALRGESGSLRERLCVIMAERHPWMLNSHAYGEPGGALGLLSLAVAHRPSFDAVWPAWRWKFLNAWEPGYGLRYSTPHMGAPYMGGESVVNLAYSILMSVPSGGLAISGGDGAPWM